MALCRCINHRPQGKKHNYICYVLPVGYYNTALICGNPSCNQPGLIWLDQNEVQQYNNGQLIFNGPNNFTKMQAQPKTLHCPQPINVQGKHVEKIKDHHELS